MSRTQRLKTSQSMPDSALASRLKRRHQQADHHKLPQPRRVGRGLPDHHESLPPCQAAFSATHRNGDGAVGTVASRTSVQSRSLAVASMAVRCHSELSGELGPPQRACVLGETAPGAGATRLLNPRGRGVWVVVIQHGEAMRVRRKSPLGSQTR